MSVTADSLRNPTPATENIVPLGKAGSRRKGATYQEIPSGTLGDACSARKGESLIRREMV